MSAKKEKNKKGNKPAASKGTVAQTPAIKNSPSPAIAEKATPPAVAEKAASPAIAKKAPAPAVAEKASPPATKEVSMPPAKAEKSASPAIVEKSPPPAVQGNKTIVSTADYDSAIAAPNPYLPHIATIMEVISETALIKTLRVTLDDTAAMKAFTFKPGQVGQLSVFGVGEATFVINSPPSQKNYLQFSIMKAGEVTAALHKLAPGDKIGVRAPLGNHFPSENWKGKDIFFVGGGIGMAPIRTIMMHLLDNKQDYGKISLLYGARSPRDMAYTYELDDWLRNKNLSTTLTIDQPFDNWEYKVGLIPNILLEIAPKADNCLAVLCGPPIMIKFTVEALKKLNFPDDQIITTLERRMKCGIGICGRCNLGPKYICIDGPVFTWAELKDLPPEL